MIHVIYEDRGWDGNDYFFQPAHFIHPCSYQYQRTDYAIGLGDRIAAIAVSILAGFTALAASESLLVGGLAGMLFFYGMCAQAKMRVVCKRHFPNARSHARTVWRTQTSPTYTQTTYYPPPTYNPPPLQSRFSIPLQQRMSRQPGNDGYSRHQVFRGTSYGGGSQPGMDGLPRHPAGTGRRY